MADVFQLFLQNGRIDVGFLGGAQVDRYGNLNTTVLGPYERPRVRLPGAGGAPEIAIHAKRTLIVARLEKRAFPETVDFITSPGHRPHGRTRRELGMPGAGPVRVITDRGILDADAGSGGELVLTAVYPGVSVDEVRAKVGWELRVREPLREVEPPGEEVLRVLRERLDPERRYLGAE
jgi:glutaconate CoA-transferase subunit B